MADDPRQSNDSGKNLLKVANAASRVNQADSASNARNMEGMQDAKGWVRFSEN